MSSGAQLAPRLADKARRWSLGAMWPALGGGTNPHADLGASGGGGATSDISAILLAAVSSSGPITAGAIESGSGVEPATTTSRQGTSGDSALVPATAGASGAAIPGEGSGDAAFGVTTTRGDISSFAPQDATSESAAGAGNASFVPLSVVAATSAGSISRTWIGGGTFPYLFAGYLAVHGCLAQACKRCTLPSHNAHPLTPASRRVGTVGSHCHLALKVSFVSSRTANNPA